MRSIVAGLAWALLAAFVAPGARAQGQTLPDFADLVDKVTPSVVIIRTTERVRPGANPQSPDDQELDDLYRRFFGTPPDNSQSTPAPGKNRGTPKPPTNPGAGAAPPSPSDREVPRSLGSGFIISSDGYILTNAHVVEGASDIYVTLTDKREFKAKVVGSDERTDLALIKIDATNLPKMPIGDSKAIRVGQWVLAIGSPFGLENTVTAGIVSAKSRDTGDYLPFIQTDTAVNLGNSGGPLVNMRGEAIGVNSQILSETGGSIGISFAIPIDEAMRVTEQLRTLGRVVRGRLGVEVKDLPRELAEAINIKGQGAFVARVERGSPAEKGGIQAGDIILKFDNQPIEHSSDLPRAVGETRPGTHSTVQIWHRGTVRDVGVVVAELDAAAPKVPAHEEPAPVGNALGLAVTDLSDDRRRDLGLHSGGVEVTAVDGAAATADVRQGDIILGLNSADVTSAKQFNDLVTHLDPKKQAYLLIRRGDVARYVPIRPGG